MGTTTPRNTLAMALADRNSALNFLRLILAAGRDRRPHLPAGRVLGGWFASISGISVYGFFAISGYLIAASRERVGLGSFLVRRSARIMPGFWVCLVVTAFVFAPAAALMGGETWVPTSRCRSWSRTSR